MAKIEYVPEYVRNVECKPILLVGKIEKREFLDICLKTQGSDVAVCILMNPSEATKEKSDKTVNKVIEFMYKYDKGGVKFNRLIILNLFSVYKPDSSKLYETLCEVKSKLGLCAFEQIIESNRCCIRKIISLADYLILGWGDSPKKFVSQEHATHVEKVLSIVSQRFASKGVYVFKTSRYEKILTKHEHPRHPSRNKLTGLVPCCVKDNTRIVAAEG